MNYSQRSKSECSRVLAVIPARGGSKGVPGKNIRPLNGKPLIAYTIKCALECSLVDRVVVSTDSEEILSIAEKNGAEVPFLRPSEIAQDTTPDQPVLKHALQWLSDNEGYAADYLLLLRPTTPFKEITDIEAVLNKLENGNSDFVRTVCRVEGVHHPYWMYKEVDGQLVSFVDHLDLRKYLRRQNLPPVHRINGLVDGFKANYVLTSTNMWQGPFDFVVTPEEKSIDIDTEFDFQLAEFLIHKNFDFSNG